jgi:uncharacterized protein (DUF4415 family)
MMKSHKNPLTPKELSELPDEAVDYSDIPELDEEFWDNAHLMMPEAKERITLRIDREVVEYFRSGGHGYQTRMNAVLRAYMEAQRSKKRHKPAR